MLWTTAASDPIVVRMKGQSLNAARAGRSRIAALVAAVLLAAFALQCILSMREASPTSDEVPHLAAGYSYLKTGDYRLNREHPPLLKLIAALPLLAMDLDFDLAHPSWRDGQEWVFGEQFVNQNRVPAQRIIFWGRLPMVALGVLLGILVFRWAREIYGARAGLLALFLYAFCPTMLANAPLVTMDVGIALFTVLAMYAFSHLAKRPTLANTALAGCALGLALGSKVTGLAIIPIWAILGVIFVWKGHGRRPSLRHMIKRAGLILLFAAVIVLLLYHVTAIPQYFGSLKHFVKDVGAGGRPAFLFGEYSTHGWFYYFLAAMLVKTPVPALVLICLAAALLVTRRTMRFEEYCVLVPAVFYLAVASASRLQLGIRYILLVYPLLFIFVGGAAAGLLGAKRALKRLAPVAVAVLLLWYCVGTLRAFPHYLAYFNELVGGPKNGYRCLIDSNLDWGQDLPGLAKFLKQQGNPEVILSFFGTASPKSYGITYQDFYSFNLSGRREDHVNSLNPSKELFVISANSLQCLYYPDKTTYDWLKQRQPLAAIGYSLFVYDVTRDSDAQTRFGARYLSGNLIEKAERQMRRALAIDPANRQASMYLDSLERRSSRSTADLLQ